MPDCFYFLYNNISKPKNQDFPEKNLLDFAFSAFCIDTFFKKACFSLIYTTHKYSVILHIHHAVTTIVFHSLCITAIYTTLHFQRASGHMVPVCLLTPRTESAWSVDSSRLLPPPHCTWRALLCEYCSHRAS